jgi:hypothetical protein
MPASTAKKPSYMLSLVGRYKTKTRQNEPQVTANLLTGTDDHFIYSGTLTMTEAEWNELVSVLRRGLKDRLVVTKGTEGWHPIPERKPGPSRAA